MATMVPLFLLALFVIYTLLAIPLRSYGQPLIIMSVIPFAFVGAIWGHIIMKSLGMLSSLAIMSILGLIAASGVVVNSSLVLVHGINARRAEGLSVHDAVIEAVPPPSTPDMERGSSSEWPRTATSASPQDRPPCSRPSSPRW